MALVATTHTALRAAIQSGIIDIAPTDPYENRARWTPQDDPDQVATSGIRHFSISSMGQSSEVAGGLIGGETDGNPEGGAIENETDIVIRVSYGATPQTTVEDVADADQADIVAMLRLAAATESIAGLVNAEQGGWDFFEDADGRAVLEHLITIQYMKATRR